MGDSIYRPTDVRIIPTNVDPFLPPVAVTFDWLLTPFGQLDDTYALVTAVIVALGTDRLAEDDDILPGFDDTDRRGWWGDFQAAQLRDGWPIGTRLWLLWRHKITGERAQQGSSTARAREYAYEALQPFIERGVCSDIEVSAVRSAIDTIDLEVTLIRGPEPNITLRYRSLWSDIVNPPYGPPLPKPPVIPAFVTRAAGQASGFGAAVAVGGFISSPLVMPGVGQASGVGAAVAVSSFIFAIDLTNAANIVVTRTGDVLAQIGDNAASVIASGQPIIETMDGWTGVWSHKAITNLTAWDFPPGVFTDVGSPVITAGQSDPAGGVNAIAVYDNNTGATAYRYYSQTAYTGMIWARTDTTNPPSTPGCVTMNFGATDEGTTEPVTSSTWTRFEFGAGSPIAAGTLNAVQLYPAGAAAPGSFTVSATGAAHYYWPFMTLDVQKNLCPMAKTAIPAAGVQLSADFLPFIGADGTLDIELEFLPSWQAGVVGYASSYLWSANSGDHSLRTDAAGVLILRIGGVDRFTGTVVAIGLTGAVQTPGGRGQLVRVRAWWDTIRNECGIRMSVGGATAYTNTGTTTGAALSSITDFWIGSNGTSTTGVMTARHRKLVTRKSTSRAFAPQGIFLGDVTSSNYLVDVIAAPSFIYSWSEQQTDRIRCLALPSDRSSDQKTRWLALSSTERAGASWVAIQVGLYDVRSTLADSSATIIARIQDLVSTVRANNATCKILIGLMTPAKQRLIDVWGATDGAAQQVKFDAVNAAIAGTGSTPITGVDARVTAYYDTLNDGTGNLASVYDTGDHIRINNVACKIIADDYRTALVGLGLI